MKNSVFGASALAIAVLLGASPALAQSSEPLDLVLQTLGLQEAERPEIDYRERAPLVVPPATTLVPPQDKLSAGTPRWPQDPEIVRKKKALEDAKKPKYPVNDGDKRELRDEFASSLRTAPAGRRLQPRTAEEQQRNTDGLRDNPREVFGFITTLVAPKEEESTQYVEPPREYLTDPPKGMRSAAGGFDVRATPERAPKIDTRSNREIRDEGLRR